MKLDLEITMPLTTYLWFKPVSTFGLSRVTTFIKDLHLLIVPTQSLAPLRHCAGRFSFPSQGRLPIFIGGYIVPRASHQAVTSFACPGRERLMEQPVLSVILSPVKQKYTRLSGRRPQSEKALARIAGQDRRCLGAGRRDTQRDTDGAGLYAGAAGSPRFAGRAEASFVTAIRRTRMRAAMTALLITAVMGAIIFVLWVGANQVQAGGMTGGQLASFILYAVLVAGGVGTMANVGRCGACRSEATGRLLELLHAQPAITDASAPQPLPQPRQAAIRFEHVSFHYPARVQVAALDDITPLDIPHGETVALVGPSGAGKTTLFQLLLRFYDVTGGCIRLNGQDIRQLSLHELRDRIAIVPQDPVIFSANALENIRYGRRAASNAEVIAAARSAQVDEFIHRLPDGYQTFLGERGTRLSGGQRQRIAIARAILKNAPLLLLDEATSALDAESEILVQQGLNAPCRGAPP